LRASLGGGSVTRARFLGSSRGHLGPHAPQFHPGRIREERGQVILPQGQEAAGEVRGIRHDIEYTPRSRAEKQSRRLACVFDEALPPKHCIVGVGDDPRGEKTRA
jgi:hypothetical protein